MRFNPRSRAGSDSAFNGGRTLSAGFNPRSRAGSDFNDFISSINANLFQSTLPRGERLYTQILIEVEKCFNPRSRAGSDFVVNPAPVSGNVSIHAPARGATLTKVSVLAIVIVSIHAPARGATGYYGAPAMSWNGFNPRSRAGSDNIE